MHTFLCVDFYTYDKSDPMGKRDSALTLFGGKKMCVIENKQRIRQEEGKKRDDIDLVNNCRHNWQIVYKFHQEESTLKEAAHLFILP